MRPTRVAAANAVAKRQAAEEKPKPLPKKPRPTPAATTAGVSSADGSGGSGGTSVPEWVPPLLSVGAGGERFYGAVRVGEDTFHVGDTVMMRVDGLGDKQVSRIEALWEDIAGSKMFEGRWYYSPEETTCGKLVGHDDREIFESVHIDENLVDTIDSHCTVMEWDAYQRWLDQPVGEDDDEEETTFVCRAMYYTGSGEFGPLTGASTFAEAVRVGGRHLQLPQPRAGAGVASSTASSEVLPPPQPSYAPFVSEARGLSSGLLLPAAGRRERRLGRFAEAAARLAPSAMPERMPCREKERAEVIAALRAAVLEGTLGGSLYLSGTPGTGKTATVHQALRELTADKSLHGKFRTTFVNGMKLTTPYQVRPPAASPLGRRGLHAVPTLPPLPAAARRCTRYCGRDSPARPSSPIALSSCSRSALPCRRLVRRPLASQPRSCARAARRR